jgi:tRNA uridine 5-carboxymethylaminomethyl modification enzyme
MFLDKYDLIVVGAGHAGSEAAACSASLGSKILLITMNLQNIAQMSCNPAIGGIAKGQIIREIDALGGLSAIITDKSMIQFRMLNKSKGPAMWSPRAQCDRMIFSTQWRNALERNPNIDFLQDKVVELIVEKEKIVGVKTSLGIKIKSKAVILTNGTFLGGLIHIGRNHFSGGRMAEKASFGLTEQLKSFGFVSGRMKTGTPPRVDGRSLDYCKMEIQEGDLEGGNFSFLNKNSLAKQKPCYITYTNEKVHEILKEGFEDSPLFNGSIQSIGPRYCPSIEDKITRFADKNRHQIFVEPEGWETIEIYVNGFSTSLPYETQQKALKEIPGFEKVKIFRPGYAIEYDYFPPTQLKYSLETRIIENLFFAGQINGTTGYEEAAAQGLMAGINAHLKIKNKEAFVLKRNEAYIGVLIDDLISKGTQEPYRMFTSRAEYRTLLRGDNADERLTPLAYKLGLASKQRMEKLEKKEGSLALLLEFFANQNIQPEEINSTLQKKESSLISQAIKAAHLLARPQLEIGDFLGLKPISNYLNQNPESNNKEILEKVSIEIKYKGYIEREKEQAQKLTRLEAIKIPKNFDYTKINSISTEARQKLAAQQPNNIGQASRISGVSPSDVSILLIYMGR